MGLTDASHWVSCGSYGSVQNRNAGSQSSVPQTKKASFPLHIRAVRIDNLVVRERARTRVIGCKIQRPREENAAPTVWP